MNWYSSNTNSHQALGLPSYCIDVNSRHLAYPLTWKSGLAWNSRSGQQKTSVPALGQAVYFYCHNRLRNAPRSPEELNRQKTPGQDAGNETFSISILGRKCPSGWGWAAPKLLGPEAGGAGGAATSRLVLGIGSSAMAPGQRGSWQRSHHSTKIKSYKLLSHGRAGT